MIAWILHHLPLSDRKRGLAQQFFWELEDNITDPFKEASTYFAALINRIQQAVSEKLPQKKEKKPLRIKIQPINITFEFGHPSPEIEEDSIISHISLKDRALQVASDTFSKIYTSISSLLSRQEPSDIILFPDNDPNGQAWRYTK